jgi:CO dehydrogenase nickel-insertion accessory protein CooC1
MRTFWKWALVLAVPAVWVAAARPAELPVPEGTTVKLILLRQKSVQKELTLTADDVKKIMEFTNKQYEAARKALELSKEQRQKKFQTLGKENRKFLADNLKPEQLKRLNQITMQFTGLMLLTRPEVAKELSLTQDQVRKFKQLQTEARKKLGELLDKDSEGRAEAFAKHREETRKKIMAILTAKQRVKVRQMVGKPFKGEIVFEKAESKDEDK